MQKEITVREIEETLNQYDNIDEPILVKRENKSDVVIISMEKYKEKLYLTNDFFDEWFICRISKTDCKFGGRK